MSTQPLTSPPPSHAACMPQASGNGTLTPNPQAAAEAGGFALTDYYVWRIHLQIVGMVMDDKRLCHSEQEIETWKIQVFQSLMNLNSKAQGWELPSDLPPPTADYRARNAMGNWLDELTRDLTCLFLNVPSAATSRTDANFVRLSGLDVDSPLTAISAPPVYSKRRISGLEQAAN